MTPPESTPPLALLFPGQGSQQIGMGVGLSEVNASAAQTFAEAESVLGWSVLSLCGEGPMERLTATEHLQPTLLTVSVAAYRALLDRMGPDWLPAATLGHSLGEFSALVAAGALSFEQALKLVELRGKAMAEAVPAGHGGMAAVIGLDAEQVEQVCATEAQGEILCVANLNAPGQVVVSGQLSALKRARQSFKQAGARGVIPLKVSSPFHCALMGPAARRLADALAAVDLQTPRCPVLSNVTGRPHGDQAAIRKALEAQVVHPVLWTDCVSWVLDQGVRNFVELGPGKVLAGLLRRIERSARCLELADSLGLERLDAFLVEEAA
ncbi:MAG: ACP S-malonyltransferase [Deltaproteobacteria bacterium]|nr:ACP S-malonyltransferase [Deltaproteobacteria bacterium]